MKEEQIKVEPGVGAIPQVGERYYYIRSCMQLHCFKVLEAQWRGGFSDLLRLTKGNVYMTLNGANAVCMNLNERLDLLKELCDEREKKVKLESERKRVLEAEKNEAEKEAQKPKKQAKKKLTTTEKMEAYERNKKRIHPDIID